MTTANSEIWPSFFSLTPTQYAKLLEIVANPPRLKPDPVETRAAVVAAEMRSAAKAHEASERFRETLHAKNARIEELEVSLANAESVYGSLAEVEERAQSLIGKAVTVKDAAHVIRGLAAKLTRSEHRVRELERIITERDKLIEHLTSDAWVAMKRNWKQVQAQWPLAPGRFKTAVRQAVRRGHTWNIDPDTYANLVSWPCSVCGGPVGNGVGLDRLNNRLGYSLDNVRPCCGPCNIARGRKPIV